MNAPVGSGAPIWVVVDREDAGRLPAEALSGRVLAITPVARAALVGKAADMVDARRHFGDWAQARTVAAVRRARRKLESALAGLPGADEIHREIALDHFQRSAYTGYRLWFTLGADGPWMVAAGEDWQRAETHEAAYAALLRRMLTPLVTGQARVARVGTPPLPALYRRLRQALLRAACRNRPTFVSGARKGMFGLLDAIAGDPARPRIVVVQSSGGGWRDYLRLARGAWRMAAGERFLDVSLITSPCGDSVDAADRLIESVDDLVIAEAFSHYRELLAYRLAQAAPAREDARAIVSAASPKHYLSADASRISDWSLAAACGERRVTRWVLSRNTHVAPTSRMAEDACRSYFYARYPKGLVDQYVFWTPHGANAAREFLPRELHHAIIPVRAVAIPDETRGNAPPRIKSILVADTYSAFWTINTWAFQTSDEFLYGLENLVKVALSLPDVKIVVRAKDRAELPLSTYVRLFQKSNRLVIRLRSGEFRNDLQNCDLLVASRSTTIEEALHLRKPVLLWGGTSRYRYLPSTMTLPTATKRSAIYSADTAASLHEILPRILEHHSGKPLTDDELSSHIWPNSEDNIEAFCRRLLSGTDPLTTASASNSLHEK